VREEGLEGGGGSDSLRAWRVRKRERERDRIQLKTDWIRLDIFTKSAPFCSFCRIWSFIHCWFLSVFAFSVRCVFPFSFFVERERERERDLSTQSERGRGRENLMSYSISLIRYILTAMRYEEGKNGIGLWEELSRNNMQKIVVLFPYFLVKELRCFVELFIIIKKKKKQNKLCFGRNSINWHAERRERGRETLTLIHEGVSIVV